LQVNQLLKNEDGFLDPVLWQLYGARLLVVFCELVQDLFASSYQDWRRLFGDTLFHIQQILGVIIFIGELEAEFADLEKIEKTVF